MPQADKAVGVTGLKDFKRETVFAYSLDEINALMRALGEPAYKAKSFIEWLYKRWAPDYSAITTLSKITRARLEQLVPLTRASVLHVSKSKDGTRKYLVELFDGELIEVVGLPTFSYKALGNKGSDEASRSIERLSVCISSQVGCAMGCTFCATGKAGFTRNLLPGELAEQIRIVEQDFETRVSNVVVMGQGEPFANYGNVLAGLRIINSELGPNIGARHITISTSGVLSGIRKLASEEEQFTLAVSLHSAHQPTRDRLMPGLKSQNLDELKKALIDYTQASRRRASLEYTLIDGPSSSNREVEAFADFAREVGAHVNLIPINDVSAIKPNDTCEDSEVLHPPSKSRIKEIASLFEKHGVAVTTRASRGADIDAACGQLLAKIKGN